MTTSRPGAGYGCRVEERIGEFVRTWWLESARRRPCSCRRRRGARPRGPGRRQPWPRVVPALRRRPDGDPAPLREAVPVRGAGGHGPRGRPDRLCHHGAPGHGRLRCDLPAQPRVVAVRASRPALVGDGAAAAPRHRRGGGLAGRQDDRCGDRLPVDLLHHLLGGKRFRHRARSAGARGGGSGRAARNRAGDGSDARRGRGAPADRTRAPRRDRPLGFGDDRAGGSGAPAPAARSGA